MTATSVLTRVPVPHWDLALCAQVDPELWYPPSAGTPEPAKKICRRCPITSDCLAWALATDQRYGVWGGTSERQRRVMLRCWEGNKVAGVAQARHNEEFSLSGEA